MWTIAYGFPQLRFRPCFRQQLRKKDLPVSGGQVFSRGISIHATCMGDDCHRSRWRFYPYFYSRHPHGWRPPLNSSFLTHSHPSQSGLSWRWGCNSFILIRHFYSRHPHGRRIPWKNVNSFSRFLFTPPIRAATRIILMTNPDHNISIHATHMGSDGKSGEGLILGKLFLFTLPMWAATPSRQL